ncbi:MAG: MmcQ/YjbR family DNA-binding protein [Bacillota bacterium]
MDQNENMSNDGYNDILDQIRGLCLSFPGTSERLSHGAQTFFVNEKKSFVQYHLNHHGDGKAALWCAAPSGAQTILVESNPEIYYIPAYVGHLGWVGVRLDRKAKWSDVKGVIQDAYLTKAPKKYVEIVRAEKKLMRD